MRAVWTVVPASVKTKSLADCFIKNYIYLPSDFLSCIASEESEARLQASRDHIGKDSSTHVNTVNLVKACLHNEA